MPRAWCIFDTFLNAGKDIFENDAPGPKACRLGYCSYMKFKIAANTIHVVNYMLILCYNLPLNFIRFWIFLCLDCVTYKYETAVLLYLGSKTRGFLSYA
jgi:hypothetical protein